MLKSIIIIEDNEKEQCDTLEDVVKVLIDEKFYDMTKKQQIEKMRIKALANCLKYPNIKIVEECDTEDLKEKFIIKDEMTYILSLVMTNRIVLLERNDSNVFSFGLNKENKEGNYVIINTFVKEILENYIKKSSC